MDDSKTWDKEVDVAVVGYGLAGAVSAIAAHDAGAKVLLLEKQRHPGGNSILSGGALLITADRGDAIRYLKQLSEQRLGDDMAKFMAQRLFYLSDYFQGLAKAVGAKVETLYMPHILYPFPGRESFRTLVVESVPGIEEHDLLREALTSAEERAAVPRRRGEATN